MSRSWLDRLLKPARKDPREGATNPHVRRLEQRRVLNGTGMTILVDPTATEGQTVTVSADPGQAPSPQFDWTVTTEAVVIETSNEQLFEFTPPDDGIYTVQLVLTVAPGIQSIHQANVEVFNAPPQLTAGPGAIATEGSVVLYSNLGEIVDPGFSDPALGNTESFTYSINWGDGTPLDFGTATIDRPGSPGEPTLASFDGLHVYADDGTYTVTLQVMDDNGGVSNVATTEVVVNNLPPSLRVVGDQTVEQRSSLMIVDLATISDRGFDNPADGTVETFSYTINWGDGTDADTGSATIDQTGGFAQQTLASLDGTHTYAAPGAYQVQVEVTDDDGGKSSATFNVEVLQTDPDLTVVGDQTTQEGTTLTIENIGEISDPAFRPANGDELTYSIDWGDGSAADMGVATIDQLNSPYTPTLASFDGAHTYADNGTYTVTVTVNDGDGGIDTGTFEVTVENVAPTLTVAGDKTVDEGAELSITNIGDISDPGFKFDPTDERFSYSIDWGDNSGIQFSTATIDQVGSEGVPTLASFDAAHTYADNGTYTVTVTVADDDGGMHSGTFEVTVENVAPTLTVAGDKTINEGAELSITNIGEITDPGFKFDPNDETFTYSINWGDGSSVDTGDATIDQVGSEGVPTLASFDAAHTYADNGTYTVTVTVADDDGGMHSGTFEVTVENVAPTLAVSSDKTIDEGAEISITNIGEISDPGFKFDPNDETFTYSIDWGDGSTVDTGDATIDQIGSEGVPTLASFDGAHTYADNGTYTVTVTVADDDGGMHSGTFSVTVENVAPTLTVSGDQTINEGAELSITNIGEISDPGFKFDPNDETFTYSIDWGDGSTVDTGDATIDQVGSEGVPTLASFDGAHTYADNGTYTVTVTVADDDGGMHSGTFEVIVENVAPTLAVSSDKTINEGSELAIINIGEISDPGFKFDPNDETFTYSIDWGDGSSVDTGDATIDQFGSEGLPTLASFDGAHTYADNGTYTVTVTVADDDGGTHSGTFTVMVENVAPTLTVTGDKTINEGAELSITNIGEISDPGFKFDPNDETFTYSINWGDGSSVDTGDATIDQVGSEGVPTLASFDAAHTYADNGTYTVTVTVADDDGGMHSGTFEVTVENVAPTLAVSSDKTINEGSELSITNIGEISDPGFKFDPNDETFTYSIDWGDNSAIDTGNATIDQVGGLNLPTLASFDGAHTYADNGTYTVTVTVADDDGGMHSGTFNVTVENVAPTLTVTGDKTINEGAELSITNIGEISDPGFKFDPNDETFTYSINWGDGSSVDTGDATIDQVGSEGVPTLASFDAAHTYADNGTYTVTVTVADDDGGMHSGTFEVTVENVAPTLAVSSDKTIDEGAEISITNIGEISDPGFKFDPNDETFTYSIDWGDGSTVDTGDATIDQIGSEGVPTLASFDGSHIYADNGIYTVTVTVTDDDGGMATETFSVTVGNLNPVLTVPVDQTINEGTELAITNIGQITDEGFRFPPTDETFSYSIDWGDNSAIDTGNATIDQVGGLNLPTLASFDGVHTYADNGIYTVTVTIVDDDGGTDTKAFEVTVNNVAPTLVVVDDQIVNEGELLSLTNIGAITDPGFDDSNLGSQETFTYSIDWGDGSTVDTGAATIDLVGSEGTETRASFDRSHTYADNGIYTVTVTIVDDDGGTDTKSFDVTVNNVAPTLVVVDNQVANEGELLSLTDLGVITDPGFDDPNLGTRETFSYTVDWGDQTPIDSGTATIDLVGSVGVPTEASFNLSHTYGDNDVYTVTVTVFDDDGGTTVETFTVAVNNVAPRLTGVANPFIVDEGQEFTLDDLIVGLSDPGYDGLDADGNPTTESFTATQIDWGDGNITTPVNVVDRASGSPGVLTTAGFDHAAHAYADNGTYTVIVDFADDDGGAVSQSFTIIVNNVAPTLTLTQDQFTINEGDTLDIPLLGTFSDPGYNNLLRPGGASVETFSYTIDWGDGTPVETGVLPSGVVDGSQGVLTTGTLSDSHFYADNDVDNTYTITVTLSDDDGGSHTQSFDITVLNVAPTLNPLVATDIDTNGSTTLTLSFSDPGADEFQVLVDWGDTPNIPLADSWVLEEVYAGPTPETFVITYRYNGPPDPNNITADVPISVVIRDDDFATGAITTVLGESNIEVVFIGQPGTEDAKVAIDTTADIPEIAFPHHEDVAVVQAEVLSNIQQIETNDVQSRGGELAATSDRYFLLRVVMPDGKMLEGIRLPDGAMDNLQALFDRLPDNRYRIFLIRSESQQPRLVLDIVVRDHRPIDPGDTSDGTRDKPPVEASTEEQEEPVEPTSQTTPPHQPAVAEEETPAGDPLITPRRAAAASALAAAALVLDPKTDWAVRLDQAFARADRRRWQQLRRRRPR